MAVIGLWSHLARADEPDCGQTERQIAVFEEARAAASRAGLTPQLCHLAASGGAFWHPAARYDMVRPGIAMYGLSPNPDVATAQAMGLRPAMTLSADLIVDRDVPENTCLLYTSPSPRDTR